MFCIELMEGLDAFLIIFIDFDLFGQLNKQFGILSV